MRVWALILSFVVFGQGISPGGSNEWTKVFSLLAHYQEHNEESGISFLDFLQLHYGTDASAKQHDLEDPHDEQFPFHGSPIKLSTHTLFVTNENLNFQSIEMEGLELFTPNSIGKPQYFSEDSFQPPRV